VATLRVEQMSFQKSSRGHEMSSTRKQPSRSPNRYSLFAPHRAQILMKFRDIIASGEEEDDV
jgi:hypothetical protein